MLLTLRELPIWKPTLKSWKIKNWNLNNDTIQHYTIWWSYHAWELHLDFWHGMHAHIFQNFQQFQKIIKFCFTNLATKDSCGFFFPCITIFFTCSIVKEWELGIVLHLQKQGIDNKIFHIYIEPKCFKMIWITYYFPMLIYQFWSHVISHMIEQWAYNMYTY